MPSRRRLAALAATATVGVLAALPASGSAASAPPDMCFESPQVAICSSDVGPLAQQTLSDPAGTAQLLVGVAENVACYGNDVCSAISTG